MKVARFDIEGKLRWLLPLENSVTYKQTYNAKNRISNIVK